MSEQRLRPLGGGRLPTTVAEAVEALQALVMGEADALVVETAQGPRVFTLRDASEPYRQLIERMSQAAAVLNDGVVVYCNGGISRAVGRGSIVGETMADLVAAEDRPRFDAFLREGALAQAACEAALRRGDGAPLPTRMAAAPLDFDGVACVALVMTPLEDIASWRTARSGLAESERRFRVALGNSPVGVFEQDLDLRYTWVFNPKLGLSAEEVLGRTDAELLDPSCARRFEQIKREVIATGRPIRAEVRAAAPGKPIQTFDTYVEPRRDGAGAITGVICAATDITERKRAEDLLRESEERKAFLLGLIDAFKTLDGADEIVALACERLGRRLGADQVVFAEIEETGAFATIAREWNGGAMPSNVGTHGLAGFEPTIADLRAGKTVVMDDVAHDPRLRPGDVARFRVGGIGALVSAPLVKGGCLAWALSAHCRAARAWSAAEVALVEAVAERAWAWVERARAEAALRGGERRLADAQARAGIGTWWWEIATGRTQFNATYYKLYGIAPEPHGFEDFFALVHPDDREGVRANVERALAGAGFYEVEYRLRRVDDGAERWFRSRAQAVCDGEQRPVILGGIVQDITDRKRAELALRESEERYRVLHESQRDGFVKVTLDGALVEFNAVFQEMLGHEPEELRSLTYQDLTPERWRAFEADIIRTQVLERGFSDLYEKEYRRKDGAIFPVELRGVLLRDAAGRPCYMWATVRDISARKQAETALALAKAEAEGANVAKSRFLAAASHDLRQPVQSLVLLLPLVERHINATPKAAQVLNLMNKALGGLNVLLTAVLDVSRLDAGGIEPVLETVPLSGLCQRLADEYAPKAAALGLDLRVRTLDACARTDPVLLERVLRNLVENALRYTQAGGVLLAMRRRGRTARIDVIDTGVGIAQEKQSEIFQEFTQLDNPGRDLAKGLGLGLAIVSRLSALLRLNVAVASKPSRGSRFSVSLDVAEPAAPKAAPESASAPRSGSVLVIEDNQILRLAIEAILSESGYDTLAVASGEEAVALVNARRSLDAIVTDYRLGAGLNGVEAAREIERRLGRTLPKLLLTGEAGNRQFEEVDLTSFEFLYKPISADKLQAKLAAMMQGDAFASEVDA
jgi:PAS domain S-box-containing protein